MAPYDPEKHGKFTEDPPSKKDVLDEALGNIDASTRTERAKLRPRKGAASQAGLAAGRDNPLDSILIKALGALPATAAAIVTPDNTIIGDRGDPSSQKTVGDLSLVEQIWGEDQLRTSTALKGLLMPQSSQKAYQEGTESDLENAAMKGLEVFGTAAELVFDPLNWVVPGGVGKYDDALSGLDDIVKGLDDGSRLTKLTRVRDTLAREAATLGPESVQARGAKLIDDMNLSWEATRRGVADGVIAEGDAITARSAAREAFDDAWSRLSGEAITSGDMSLQKARYLPGTLIGEAPQGRQGRSALVTERAQQIYRDVGRHMGYDGPDALIRGSNIGVNAFGGRSLGEIVKSVNLKGYGGLEKELREALGISGRLNRANPQDLVRGLNPFSQKASATLPIPERSTFEGLPTLLRRGSVRDYGEASNVGQKVLMEMGTRLGNVVNPGLRRSGKLWKAAVTNVSDNEDVQKLAVQRFMDVTGKTFDEAGLEEIAAYPLTMLNVARLDGLIRGGGKALAKNARIAQVGISNYLDKLEKDGNRLVIAGTSGAVSPTISWSQSIQKAFEVADSSTARGAQGAIRKRLGEALVASMRKAEVPVDLLGWAVDDRAHAVELTNEFARRIFADPEFGAAIDAIYADFAKFLDPHDLGRDELTRAALNALTTTTSISRDTNGLFDWEAHLLSEAVGDLFTPQGAEKAGIAEKALSYAEEMGLAVIWRGQDNPLSTTEIESVVNEMADSFTGSARTYAKSLGDWVQSKDLLRRLLRKQGISEEKVAEIERKIAENIMDTDGLREALSVARAEAEAASLRASDRVAEQQLARKTLREVEAATAKLEQVHMDVLLYREMADTAQSQYEMYEAAAKALEMGSVSTEPLRRRLIDLLDPETWAETLTSATGPGGARSQAPKLLRFARGGDDAAVTNASMLWQRFNRYLTKTRDIFGDAIDLPVLDTHALPTQEFTRQFQMTAGAINQATVAREFQEAMPPAITAIADEYGGWVSLIRRTDDEAMEAWDRIENMGVAIQKRQQRATPPFRSRMSATFNDDAQRLAEIAEFDALPDDAPVVLFHGTTAENAAQIESSGRVAHSPRGDDVSAVTEGRGMYVAPTYVDADRYAGEGGRVVEVVVPKSALRPSPESGTKSLGAALYHSFEGALLPEGTALDVVGSHLTRVAGGRTPVPPQGLSRIGIPHQEVSRFVLETLADGVNEIRPLVDAAIKFMETGEGRDEVMGYFAGENGLDTLNAFIGGDLTFLDNFFARTLESLDIGVGVSGGFGDPGRLAMVRELIATDPKLHGALKGLLDTLDTLDSSSVYIREMADATAAHTAAVENLQQTLYSMPDIERLMARRAELGEEVALTPDLPGLADVANLTKEQADEAKAALRSASAEVRSIIGKIGTRTGSVAERLRATHAEALKKLELLDSALVRAEELVDRREVKALVDALDVDSAISQISGTPMVTHLLGGSADFKVVSAGIEAFMADPNVTQYTNAAGELVRRSDEQLAKMWMRRQEGAAKWVETMRDRTINGWWTGGAEPKFKAPYTQYDEGRRAAKEWLDEQAEKGFSRVWGGGRAALADEGAAKAFLSVAMGYPNQTDSPYLGAWDMLTQMLKGQYTGTASFSVRNLMGALIENIRQNVDMRVSKQVWAAHSGVTQMRGLIEKAMSLPPGAERDAVLKMAEQGQKGLDRKYGADMVSYIIEASDMGLYESTFFSEMATRGADTAGSSTRARVAEMSRLQRTRAKITAPDFRANLTESRKVGRLSAQTRFGEESRLGTLGAITGYIGAIPTHPAAWFERRLAGRVERLARGGAWKEIIGEGDYKNFQQMIDAAEDFTAHPGVESLVRVDLYVQRRLAGDTPEQAAFRVMDSHFDYSDLSGFDIRMRRIMPFWIWKSRSLAHYSEMMLHHPVMAKTTWGIWNERRRGDDDRLGFKYDRPGGGADFNLGVSSGGTGLAVPDPANDLVELTEQLFGGSSESGLTRPLEKTIQDDLIAMYDLPITLAAGNDSRGVPIDTPASIQGPLNSIAGSSDTGREFVEAFAYEKNGKWYWDNPERAYAFAEALPMLNNITKVTGPWTDGDSFFEKALGAAAGFFGAPLRTVPKAEQERTAEANRIRELNERREAAREAALQG